MAIADSFGLDYFPMHYEVCPADIIYTIAAYGMPTRFSHWSFGKSFHRMKMQYDFNLNRIYELVINSNPCYAFLLEGNNLIQNKLVSAHVLGHSDFFKNNNRFRNTSRYMVESMSVAAERIRQYESEYGIQAVEDFLDSVIAIQEHIDPSLFERKGQEDLFTSNADVKKRDQLKASRKETAYDDLWGLDATDEEERNSFDNLKSRYSCEISEKDLLYFIMENSKILESWQRDIISINEGWASFS
ncbi:hypothetical protein BHU72_10035 [Desulfuribacillus stibiiarsenatis]|uniref:SpoVR protein-like N-terminal domain-containing protein n=1 Tax=Desulfuribacillus stibiiarsenatis TaxID=1390249 RepID=A0A1E5L8Y5_9FIRM|nr:SpoVR family protein [Desulfuribacillus stibiiarsenatis]OEH86591.1 hypothetical protein BHU72_10035 [Desulfuribacillus stibiiarsenatis]